MNSVSVEIIRYKNIITQKIVIMAAPVANLQVSPPDKLSFTTPNWTQWKKRFERYMSVSGLAEKSDQEKIDILVYVMGEESEEILVQFPQLPTTYVGALKMFEDHFIPKKNVIFERYKFNSRAQRAGESIELFITALHGLAENCEYGALKDELIRDRIVVGMLDVRTSERMQLQANLSLKDAITIAKQAEIQQRQSQILHSEAGQRGSVPKSSAVAVSAVTANRSAAHGSRAVAKPVNNSGRSYQKGENGKHSKVCSFCGLLWHQRDKCPARASTCRSCNKAGHWAKVCRKKTVRSVQMSDGEDSSSFLGSIKHAIHHLDSKEWTIKAHLSKIDKEIVFLVDTGADITCLPYNLVTDEVLRQIKSNNHKVTGPAGNVLNCRGSFSAILSYGSEAFKADIYVIDNLSKPILGRAAIVALKVLKIEGGLEEKQIYSIKDSLGLEIYKLFPDVFNNIGTFKTEMEIKVRSDVQPYAQSVPRTVPIPLLKPLKEELQRLVSLDIIEAVDDYTPWVSPIVVVQKNGKIRLCVDYIKLNKGVLRSYFPINKVESSLAQISNSKYFSKLDTNSGFYQIKLTKASQPLTTFITPFGRYFFKRVPFGLTCAPEYFSILLNKILLGINGVISHIDDILIHAPTVEEHNKILKEVLSRIQNEGITLNKDKCVFGVQSLTFLGHIISPEGISIDPERISCINNFPEPKNKKELLQFLGMVNFSSRFIPNRSHILEPLTSLLKKNVMFCWDVAQKQAFKEIKMLLQVSPCLSHYDTSKSISISADASSYGIGACLLQGHEGERKVVAYASRLLSVAEKRYAQIEREALAITWAATKFQEYILGIPIVIETDHKPLVQVLQTKNLDELTPRLQRFRIRLLRYEYKIVYTPGKELVVADALSRNFNSNAPYPAEEELENEVEAHVNLIVRSLTVKSYLLDEIKEEQSKDIVCKKLKELLVSGWPNKNKLGNDLLPYYQYRFEISFSEGLLLRGNRIIIPSSLQLQCLELLHQGHQGIVKCRARAKSSVWWLGLSTQIENLVRNCPSCVEYRINPREPFHKEDFPDRPWQKIALDLFKHDSWYLIVTDYYSRFFEIFKLQSMSESVIISKLKELFSRYGIPDIVRSDNGPQFQSHLKKFARECDFKHITSSPYFSQSNGGVEAAVKVAKNLLRKNADIFEGLLSYRTTPLACGFSPSELLMNRKLKSNLPILPSLLKETVDTRAVFEMEERNKGKTISYYNKRHRVKNLSLLSVGDSVWVTDLRAYGKIISILTEPRSYLVETDFGKYRRNRWHLLPAPFFVGPKFTPTLPSYDYSNVSCNRTEENRPEFETTTADNETYVDCNSKLVVPASSSSESLSSEKVESRRPVRLRNQPPYLADYVCM